MLVPHPIHDALRAARAAAATLAYASTAAKNRALTALSRLLREREAGLLAANAEDMAQADTRGLTVAQKDRLLLTPQRIAGIAQAVDDVAALPDPVGQITRAETRPNGLKVSRVRVPLGVIGILYEARPNVTVDAAALCIKSGNAVVLRGGKEADATNAAFGALVSDALRIAELPEAAVTVLARTDRSYAEALVKAVGLVDLVIPRGGPALVEFVAEHARVPVLYHAKGNCHVYVHASADPEMARRIVVNAKAQRPGVCNAAETLLIDAGAAAQIVPLCDALTQAGVAIRGDEAVRAAWPQAEAASDADWDTEYLEKIIAVRVVRDLDEALAHIRHHGSNHTEAIVASDPAAAARFTREVDASAVMVNASTRFNDGGELGLGAEMGISTSKLHAYGPMGLEELTTTKFVVEGSGQVRG